MVKYNESNHLNRILCLEWKMYVGLRKGMSDELLRQPSVQFSHSVVSDFLQPHEMQHARLPCPSLSPKVCSNSCPWSRWCHSTVSSSLVPFSFHLQSFPASESFPMSRLLTSGGQSIGVSATSSISSTNECSVLISFRMHWLDLLAIQGTLKSLLQHHNSKASVLRCSAFFMCSALTSIHDYWKNHSFE